MFRNRKPHSHPTRTSMDSSHIHGPCTEHKLSVVTETDDKVQDQRAKRLQRAQWLRAALLGANDGLLSTTSLMLGVGATSEDRWSMILSGLSGAVAGACSMAVGEFVSVSTQRDIEKMCGQQNCEGPKPEASTTFGTPTGLSSSPSVTPSHRIRSAYQLRSPLSNANADELNVKGAIMEVKEDPSPARTPGRRLSASSPGRSPMMRVIAEEVRAQKGLLPATDDAAAMLPNPIKAAGASALAFICGSLVPLVSTMFLSENKARIVVLPLVTSIALVLFGGTGAYLGGSPLRTSAVRLLIGGWIAMAITYGLLKPFDHDRKGKEGDQK